MQDYHDATLKFSTIDWESGAMSIAFDLCVQPAQQATIMVRELSEFTVERYFPWGKSGSVNRLETDAVELGYRLQIEMQSGDKIVVIGKEVFENVEDGDTN